MIADLLLLAEMARLERAMGRYFYLRMPSLVGNSSDAEILIIGEYCSAYGVPRREFRYQSAPIDLSQIFSLHDAVAEVKKHFALAAEQFKRELSTSRVTGSNPTAPADAGSTPGDVSVEHGIRGTVNGVISL